MIKQTSVGLNSRGEANPFNEDGFLFLITAPMSSVVDETNYQVFWENKINICFPRTTNLDEVHNDPCYKDSFHAISLEEFIESFVTNTRPIGSRPYKRCIDTANGNMVALHDAIKKAKEIHGDSLIIMAGNVASVEAFVELAKTGVDYIRVGIGGGGGCNTTSNTGVGQEDLGKLVADCYQRKTIEGNCVKRAHEEGIEWYYQSNGVHKDDHQRVYTNQTNISKVKIIADGISSYIKLCQDKYGFNDNGYAAINKLLFAGADLVMIGKLFAQCLESAGEKGCSFGNNDIRIVKDETNINTQYNFKNLYVKYAGMSTQEEQKKYKLEPTYKYAVYKGNGVLAAYYETQFEAEESCSKDKGYTWKYLGNIKPSEGSVSWIPVRWTLNEWLNGSTNQDEYPYLMGWINSIKSAMSYTGKKSLT